MSILGARGNASVKTPVAYIKSNSSDNKSNVPIQQTNNNQRTSVLMSAANNQTAQSINNPNQVNNITPVSSALSSSYSEPKQTPRFIQRANEQSEINTNVRVSRNIPNTNVEPSVNLNVAGKNVVVTSKNYDSVMANLPAGTIIQGDIKSSLIEQQKARAVYNTRAEQERQSEIKRVRTTFEAEKKGYAVSNYNPQTGEYQLTKPQKPIGSFESKFNEIGDKLFGKRETIRQKLESKNYELKLKPAKNEDIFSKNIRIGIETGVTGVRKGALETQQFVLEHPVISGGLVLGSAGLGVFEPLIASSNVGKNILSGIGYAGAGYFAGQTSYDVLTAPKGERIKTGISSATQFYLMGEVLKGSYKIGSKIPITVNTKIPVRYYEPSPEFVKTQKPDLLSKNANGYSQIGINKATPKPLTYIETETSPLINDRFSWGEISLGEQIPLAKQTIKNVPLVQRTGYIIGELKGTEFKPYTKINPIYSDVKYIFRSPISKRAEIGLIPRSGISSGLKQELPTFYDAYSSGLEVSKTNNYFSSLFGLNPIYKTQNNYNSRNKITSINDYSIKSMDNLNSRQRIATKPIEKINPKIDYFGGSISDFGSDAGLVPSLDVGSKNSAVDLVGNITSSSESTNTKPFLPFDFGKLNKTKTPYFLQISETLGGVKKQRPRETRRKKKFRTKYYRSLPVIILGSNKNAITKSFYKRLGGTTGLELRK